MPLLVSRVLLHWRQILLVSGLLLHGRQITATTVMTWMHWLGWKPSSPLHRLPQHHWRLPQHHWQARRKGQLTTGDVLRVTLTVEASAERNWVAISDPVPAGATVIGDLGGQSQMLQQGSRSDGVQPAYVERGRDTWRAYFAWLPQGSATVSYTLRLNGAGRFQLPPSRVEALYSPSIRAAVPNQPMVIAGR